ncbi:MAG: FlgD immunoglobulin-like domain containing protein, partial [Candidatus Marinimicrobia bacterium]|nr:FlgD immunoglobulin-like domain containing protein [Candidatus Neomarinimicrobiota bacterium]
VIPEAYALYQNYPNPFNPTTTIRYDLPEAAEVFLTIYDIKGRVVNQLQVGSQSAGSYALQWNGASQAGLQVATGVYLCRIQTASYSHVIKMLYLK